MVNLGPIALPLIVLLFVISVTIGLLLAAWFTRHKPFGVTDEILTIIVIGLLAGRVIFVLHYLHDYDSLWQMIDFRDRGIDVTGAFIAAALALFWQSLHKPAKRRALLAGSLISCIVFSLTMFVSQPNSRIVNLATLELHTLDQQPVLITELMESKLTVVNLWASWCPPCQREMPVLQQAEQDYPQVRFVLINQQEAAATIQAYLTKHDLTFSHLLIDETGEAAKRLDARGLPATFFFNENGQLVEQHFGELSAASLRATFKQIAP